MKQEPNNRNMLRNISETSSSKVLEHKVLQRNRTRNKYETVPRNGVSSLSLPETTPFD